MRIFGFELKRAQDPDIDDPNKQSFAPRVSDDGALDVVAGGAYGTYIDLEGQIKTEADLVTRYRSMALHSEVDSAITDIINDMIIVDEDQEIIKIDCSEVSQIPQLNEVIEQEFNEVLDLLKFKIQAHDIARRFYIDGRIYFHCMIDDQMPQAGIVELRYLDPRKIRKIREITNNNNPQNAQIAGSEVLTSVKQEYYLYNPKGFNNAASTTGSNNFATVGLKIAKDAVAHVTSGITDADSKQVLSWLHKAIKPLNMLKSIEDASLIYRISRSPDRRIFYVDVGNLPRIKAEQYLKDMMVRYKNKLIYDSSTGEIRDDRKHMTLLEDFWFPRKEGGRGTEVTTLPGGQNTGVLEEMNYYKQNLYQSLNVPFSRTNPEAVYSIGRATEISRDEIKFSKFIDQLRSRFNELFLKVLEKQLVFKMIIQPEQWEQIKYKIKFIYARDNVFSELKESEIMMDRLNRVQMMQPFIGTFFSHEYIRKHVLRQTDEEIAEIEAQIEQEQELIAQQQEMLLKQQGIDPDNIDGDDGSEDDGGGDSGGGKKKPPPKKKKSAKKGKK